MPDWLSESATNFIASDLFGTLVAGAFGAFFGAWGAQAVISRGQTKQAVVEELNALRAAHMLCFSITNRYMSMKRQHVRDMWNRYQQAQADHARVLETAKNHTGPQRLVFELQADLQTLPTVTIPAELLQRLVFEESAIRGRALAAAVDLVGAINSLDQSIRDRNELITEFRNAAPMDPERLIQVYLGVRNAEGVLDNRFGSLTAGVYQQTDDCIFYSRLLAGDLLEYATKLRWRYAWRLGRRVPKLNKVDWSKAEKMGLIPPEKEYQDWLAGFQKPPTKRERIIAWFKSLRATKGGRKRR